MVVGAWHWHLVLSLQIIMTISTKLAAMSRRRGYSAQSELQGMGGLPQVLQYMKYILLRCTTVVTAVVVCGGERRESRK